MSESINRRFFLGSAAAGLAASASTARLSAAGQSSGDKVVLGIMGMGGRGNDLAKMFGGIGGVEIAYVCDPDSRRAGKGAETIGKRAGTTPKAVKDFRRILDDKAVHALVVATCNHWHAPAAIFGCAAGKHAYVEKPCSHNAWEGEMLVAAARKHGRLVQMGNQRRSRAHFQEAIELIRSGTIGRPYFAQAWYSNARKDIGFGKEVPVPEWLDFDLWQGPAPRRPYQTNILHYNWHWFWHWGNGELGNNGIHHIDVCRWGLGVDFPTRVTSGGGRWAWKDDQETPDTNVVTFNFPDRKTIAWQCVSCNPHAPQTPGIEIMFYGDKGSLAIGDRGFTVYDLKNKEVKTVAKRDNDTVHMANFIDAIRVGKPLNSEIAEGHKSTLLCHLGNIAYRSGHTVDCDPKNGHILNDAEAQKFWRREYDKKWEPKV